MKAKPAQPVVRTNVVTGEEVKYGSLYKAAASLGMFAGSVTYSMRVNKPIVKEGVPYTFRRD